MAGDAAHKAGEGEGEEGHGGGEGGEEIVSGPGEMLATGLYTSVEGPRHTGPN